MFAVFLCAFVFSAPVDLEGAEQFYGGYNGGYGHGYGGYGIMDSLHDASFTSIQHTFTHNVCISYISGGNRGNGYRNPGIYGYHGNGLGYSGLGFGSAGYGYGQNFGNSYRGSFGGFGYGRPW